eukprot:1193091-Prorocentrum_minimum.AAC.3
MLSLGAPGFAWEGGGMDYWALFCANRGSSLPTRCQIGVQSYAWPQIFREYSGNVPGTHCPERYVLRYS